MPKNIRKILGDLGFSENKTAVYLTTLSIRSGSTQDIARHVSLPRTTVHEILQSLVAMGVVSFTTQGRRRTYIAESPVKLEKRQEERKRKIEGILPELLSMYDTTGFRPHVRMYEGIEGVKTVLEDTLSAKDPEIFGILSMKDLYENPGQEYMDSIVERRIKNGTKLSVIRSEQHDVPEHWQSSRGDLRQLHYAPDNMNFPMSVYMYDNKVSIIGTQKENFGMIIESAEYYLTMKNLFDVMWQVTRVGKRVD